MSAPAAVARGHRRPRGALAGSRFFTNHAHVLMCLAEDPGMRICDIAARVGVSERAITRILGDLVADGCVVRSRVGRRSRYFVVPDPPLAHPLEQHLSLEPLITAARTPLSPEPQEGPTTRPARGGGGTEAGAQECRRVLAAEVAAGWPNLGGRLAAEYGGGWRLHAERAASTLERLGRSQVGHDGVEMVFLAPRPWETIVASFVDGAIVDLAAESVATVVARARRGGLAGGERVSAQLWDAPLVTEPGLLGVALVAGEHWAVVDHTGRRVLASSASPPPGADDADPEEPPYVLVRQAVPGHGVVAVGCRQGGLGYDLTRRHPLVAVGAPLGLAGPGR